MWNEPYLTRLLSCVQVNRTFCEQNETAGAQPCFSVPWLSLGFPLSPSQSNKLVGFGRSEKNMEKHHHLSLYSSKCCCSKWLQQIWAPYPFWLYHIKMWVLLLNYYVGWYALQSPPKYGVVDISSPLAAIAKLKINIYFQIYLFI